MKRRHAQLATIGWREWVGLPDLGIEYIKVKVDTGARSSSLHAYDVQEYVREGVRYVRFKIRPVQRSRDKVIEACVPLLEYRSVRSSSGKATIRPVVVVNVTLLGQTWPVELTLANRDEMGFRMLLGRQAIRDRFLVDGGRSYYGGRPPKNKTQKPRKR